MKTIFVNARFLTQQITGVQRYAIEISRELIKSQNFRVLFLAPKNVIQKEIFKEFNAIVIGKNSGYIWEQIDLPLYLLKKKGDFILLNFCNTAPIFYKNKISTIHDVAFKVYPRTYTFSFLLLYNILIPLIIRTSKKILTVSSFSKSEIIKYFNCKSDKIDVIYNAVSSDFRPIVEKKNDIDYFMTVSSLNYRKNFISILEAFEKYKKKSLDNTKLIIVGDVKSSSFKSINISRYTNSDIIFRGRVSNGELIRLYSNAKAFLYLSFYEGFGLPPLEAQSCNCPVILSNISCFPEIFKKSVLYCNPFSIENIVDVMNSINEVNINNYVNKGIKNKKRFSWQKSANKIFQIIKILNK